MRSESLLRSPPCTVYFAGWKSTTYELSQQGWQISMDQDLFHGQIRMAIKHPEIGCVGISGGVDYDFMRRTQHAFDADHLPVFHIQRFSPGIKVQYMAAQGATAPFSMFSPVECVPHLNHFEVKDIEDLILFTKTRVQAQEIIVEEREVKSILDEILAKQSPIQAEIRDRVRREKLRMANQEPIELAPEMITHANILTFARRAA